MSYENLMCPMCKGKDIDTVPPDGEREDFGCADCGYIADWEKFDPDLEIGFYLRREGYGFMSNFYRAMQEMGGKIYKSNEHFYQSQKARDVYLRRWIADSPSAFHAMKAGRALRKNEVVTDWNIKKIVVMYNGVRAKFMQNPELCKKLLETGNAHLFEDSPSDKFWGGKMQGSKNALGRILMQVREELRQAINYVECQCDGHYAFIDGRKPIIINGNTSAFIPAKHTGKDRRNDGRFYEQEHDSKCSRVTEYHNRLNKALKEMNL